MPPPDCQEEISPGVNGQLDLKRGCILLLGWGEGLRYTTESGEVQEPVRGGEHHSSDW
jgi:hypothetical protein